MSPNRSGVFWRGIISRTSDARRVGFILSPTCTQLNVDDFDCLKILSGDLATTPVKIRGNFFLVV